MIDLYKGDCLEVMKQINNDSIDLIYIDPPFGIKQDEKFNMITWKKTSYHEPLVYDMFEKILNENDLKFLSFLYPRLKKMRELLSEKGSIYVHLDWHVGHYVKILLDEIFGKQNFLHEIVWKRKFGNAAENRKLGAAYDYLYVFSKSEKYIFNPIREKNSQHVQEYMKTRFTRMDKDGIHKGRLWMPYPLANPGDATENLVYEYKGYTPPAKGWRMIKEKLEKLDLEGKIYFPEEKSQRLQEKKFLDEYEGQPINSLWQDIFVINSQAKEALNYATQKPEQLLERILRLSSNENSIVADFFGGSGTTIAVAKKLGRSGIYCDQNEVAYNIAKQRIEDTVVEKGLFDE